MVKNKKLAKPSKSQAARPVRENHITDPQLELIRQEFIHSGPLPSPVTLDQYNNVHPGAAERIIAMAEKEQAHRHQIESRIIKTESWCQSGGLVCGLIIGLAAIVGGVVCVVTGHDYAGVFLGASGLTGLVSVFIVGNKNSDGSESSLPSIPTETTEDTQAKE